MNQRRSWVREAAGTHPLMRDLAVGRLLGWPLVAVTLASGILSGLFVIAVSGAEIVTSLAWLAVPASVPIAYCVASRRSILLGILCGFGSATLAFMTVGVYALWKVACFIITFMGEC